MIIPGIAAIAGAGSGVISALSGAVGGLASAASGALSGALGAVSGAVGGLVGAAENFLFGWLVQQVTNALGWAKNTAEGAIGDILNELAKKGYVTNDDIVRALVAHGLPASDAKFVEEKLRERGVVVKTSMEVETPVKLVLILILIVIALALGWYLVERKKVHEKLYRKVKEKLHALRGGEGEEVEVNEE